MFAYSTLVARAHIRIRLDVCLRCESLSSTLQIQLLSSPPLLLPGSVARIIHRRASLFLIKLLWNVGKADEEEVGVKRSLYRRSKILHRSVYSALWLGGLLCQYRRQTNGPLAARCPCVMVLGKKINKFCRPLKCVGPPGKCPVCPITNPVLITGYTGPGQAAGVKSSCMPDVLVSLFTNKMLSHVVNIKVHSVNVTWCKL